jgi:hypothetical protein
MSRALPTTTLNAPGLTGVPAASALAGRRLRGTKTVAFE